MNPLVQRILTGLGKSILGLALLVLTLWLGAYFALGSGPGQRALAGLVRGEAGLEPTVVRWGPAPDRLLVGGLDVHSNVEASRRPLAALTLASLDLGLWSLLGPNPTIEHLRVELAFVRANIGPDGRVDLLMVLSPPRRPGAASAPKEKAPPRFAIERLEVRVGELLVTQGAEGLHLRDLELGGRVSLGERLDASLVLRSGELHMAMDRGRRVWAGTGFELEVSAAGPPNAPSELELDLALTLRHADQRESHLALALSPGRPASVALGADLSGADAAVLLPGSDLPHGIQLAGLLLEAPLPAAGPNGPDAGSPPEPTTTATTTTTTAPGRKLIGRLGHAFAPVLGLGAAELHDASFGLSAISIDAGRLIPQVDVTFTHLQASRLVLRRVATSGEDDADTAEPFGWTLEDLDFAGGRVSFLRRLELHLWPGRARWGLPNATPELVDLAIDADLGLTGGPITAHLAGEFGAIEARGKLRVSPLTGKTGFGAELAFAELHGAFARALLPELPAEHPLNRNDAPRASGTMTLELENDEDGPAVAFDEGLVTWATGGSRWDGYGWSDEPQPLPDDQPDTAPGPDREDSP